MPRDLLRPSKIGAPGSLNFDTRNDGRAVPAFKQFTVSSTDRLHYCAGIIEYKAPTGTATGAAPRLYYGIDKTVYSFVDGAEAVDNLLDDVVQGMVLADTGGYSGVATAVTATTLEDDQASWPNDFFNGNIVRMGGSFATIGDTSGGNDLTGLTWSPSTPELGPYTIDSDGTAGLIIGFGSSATARIAYRDLFTDTTPWTEVTVAGDSDIRFAQFWLITRAGPDFYAMTDAGTTTLGEFRVSKCPAGNDPRLRTSWSNGIPVGGPEWGITGLTAIGDSPVVGRPDGLWYWNTQTRKYENVLKHLENAPHALNGKVTEPVTGGVIYTTHDGKAYFFDGASVTEVSPHKFWPVTSKDIGNSRLSAIADNGDTIAMITEQAYQTTQNAGLDIRTVTTGLAATDITANAVDGKMTTGGSLNGLAATSHIDIWSTIPFEGAVFHVTRQFNSTTTAVIGTVSYSSATDTFTADPNGFYDGTRLSSGGSFSYVAFPPSASAGLVAGKSPNFGALMQPINFNYASGTDITGMYGMRISMSVAALDASVEADEIEIIPYRPGMPNGGVYGVTTNFTGRDRAGLISHVYLIKRTKTTGFTPHDAYAVDSGPGIWKLAWHTGRLGQASGGQNLGQALFLPGRYKRIAISESLTRDPVRTRRPFLQDISTQGPGPLLQLCHEWAGRREEDWPQLKCLTRIKIDTRMVQPDDVTEFFAEFDGRDIISLGRYKGGPIDMTPANTPAFRWMNLWMAFDRSVQTVPNAPYFVEPYVIDYDLVDGELGRDVASPVVELE